MLPGLSQAPPRPFSAVRKFSCPEPVSIHTATQGHHLTGLGGGDSGALWAQATDASRKKGQGDARSVVMFCSLENSMTHFCVFYGVFKDYLSVFSECSAALSGCYGVMPVPTGIVKYTRMRARCH